MRRWLTTWWPFSPLLVPLLVVVFLPLSGSCALLPPTWTYGDTLCTVHQYGQAYGVFCEPLNGDWEVR